MRQNIQQRSSDILLPKHTKNERGTSGLTFVLRSDYGVVCQYYYNLNTSTLHFLIPFPGTGDTENTS